MPFERWYVEQFRNRLSEPLANADAIADGEIDGGLRGQSIPAAMRAYYRVAGNHWLNTNHNRLRPLSELETIDDHLVFMDENQDVVQWGLRVADLTVEDPIVYQGQYCDERYEWYSESHTFSRFMIAMWHWILTGEEPSD